MFGKLYDYDPYWIPGYEYDDEKWDTPEEIARLEEAERMVISDEALTSAYFAAKQERALRLAQKKNHKATDRIKTRKYQKACDTFKKMYKKKGYTLKYKGMTQKASAIVPSDALGWDKIGMEVMGTKMYGIKVGAIFAMT